MINNPSYYGFVAFICVLGYSFWIYPEGMNRVLIYINLQLKYARSESIKIYMKLKLLRELNKFNREHGLPLIPWNHKKSKSDDT
jgi:hypothetical protein